MAEHFDPSEVRDRADRAKVREIAAHRRAIVLHEKAACAFEGQGDTLRAGLARDRAQSARDKLAKALAEQRRYVRDMGTEGAFA